MLIHEELAEFTVEISSQLLHPLIKTMIYMCESLKDRSGFLEEKNLFCSRMYTPLN